MGRLPILAERISYSDAFKVFKREEYNLQKKIVSAKKLGNRDLVFKLIMDLHTFIPPCSEELRVRLEKSRGKFLGQCFIHKRYGYKGVIFKSDECCRMDESWIELNGIKELPSGIDQPFYHCFVDVRDRPQQQTTYVADENILLTTEAFGIVHRLVNDLFIPVPELDCYIGKDNLERIFADYY